MNELDSHAEGRARNSLFTAGDRVLLVIFCIVTLGTIANYYLDWGFFGDNGKPMMIASGMAMLMMGFAIRNRRLAGRSKSRTDDPPSA